LTSGSSLSVFVHAVKCCRSSPTGEGLFVFSSYQNETIYQTVHRASTVIAEAMRIASTNSEVWHQCCNSFKWCSYFWYRSVI